MKVLYIEDDLIDQKAFQRVAKKSNISLQIANSVSETISILSNEVFDLIISDYYLGDGTALDIINICSNQQIKIVGNKDQINLPENTNNIDFIQKPINANVFITNQYSALDLTYFNSLTEDDIDFKKELLEIALQTLPESLANIKVAMQQDNFEKIKFEVHKMKSGARVVGMKIINNLEKAELLATQKDKSTLYPFINTILTNAITGIELIKIEYSKL